MLEGVMLLLRTAIPPLMTSPFSIREILMTRVMRGGTTDPLTYSKWKESRLDIVGGVAFAFPPFVSSKAIALASKR